MALARRRLAEDPPIPAPRGLVPFLDFARLPDRAIPAFRRVLDGDGALRLAVAEVADESTVGRASWLFLHRPSGWEDELTRLAGVADEIADEVRDQQEEADARRRLQAEEAMRRRATREVAERRRELAEIKEQLAGERQARRRGDSDAGRLRRRIEELTGEVQDLAGEARDLRQREHRLRLALEEATQLGRVAGGPPTGGGDPALPGGLSTTEQAPAPLDRRALTEAVERAMGAAQVLSAALADAAGLVEPVAESVPASSAAAVHPERAFRRRPVLLPPGTFDDSVAAAEHLVRTARVVVLVDGYNVTKLARPELPLSDQRRWLVDAAVELAARSGAYLELIFDGIGLHASAPADLGRRLGVQVRFSPEGVEADDMLLQRVSQTPTGQPVVVATDDRRVQEGAAQLGANVISVRQVLAVLRRPL